MTSRWCRLWLTNALLVDWPLLIVLPLLLSLSWWLLILVGPFAGVLSIAFRSQPHLLQWVPGITRSIDGVVCAVRPGRLLLLLLLHWSLLKAWVVVAWGLGVAIDRLSTRLPLVALRVSVVVRARDLLVSSASVVLLLVVPLTRVMSSICSLCRCFVLRLSGVCTSWRLVRRGLIVCHGRWTEQSAISSTSAPKVKSCRDISTESRPWPGCDCDDVQGSCVAEASECEADLDVVMR